MDHPKFPLVFPKKSKEALLVFETEFIPFALQDDPSLDPVSLAKFFDFELSKRKDLFKFDIYDLYDEIGQRIGNRVLELVREVPDAKDAFFEYAFDGNPYVIHTILKVLELMLNRIFWFCLPENLREYLADQKSDSNPFDEYEGEYDYVFHSCFYETLVYLLHDEMAQDNRLQWSSDVYIYLREEEDASKTVALHTANAVELLQILRDPEPDHFATPNSLRMAWDRLVTHARHAPEPEFAPFLTYRNYLSWSARTVEPEEAQPEDADEAVQPPPLKRTRLE